MLLRRSANVSSTSPPLPVCSVWVLTRTQFPLGGLRGEGIVQAFLDIEVIGIRGSDCLPVTLVPTVPLQYPAVFSFFLDARAPEQKASFHAY